MVLKRFFRNDLLKRKEIEFVVESDSNPGMKTVMDAVISETKADVDCVVIKKINSNFGSREFLISAFVYDSVADLKKIEPTPKPKKGVSS